MRYRWSVHTVETHRGNPCLLSMQLDIQREKDIEWPECVLVVDSFVSSLFMPSGPPPLYASHTFLVNLIYSCLVGNTRRCRG